MVDQSAVGGKRDMRSDALDILQQYVSRAVAHGIVDWVIRETGWTGNESSPSARDAFLDSLTRATRLFVPDEQRAAQCVEKLSTRVAVQTDPREPRQEPSPTPSGGGPRDPETGGLTMKLQVQADAVRARQRVRDMAAEHGMSEFEQTKLATAISELARNAVRYAGGGEVIVKSLQEHRRARVGIEAVVADSGPGIDNLEEILEGQYRSRTGMGLGLRGAKRLTDEFHVDTAPGRGTRIRIRVYTGG